MAYINISLSTRDNSEALASKKLVIFCSYLSFFVHALQASKLTCCKQTLLVPKYFAKILYLSP